MPSSEAALALADESLSSSVDDGSNPAATFSDVGESTSDSSGNEITSTVPPVICDWQKDCGTVNERDGYILKNKWRTDLTVTVGRSEQTRMDITCHRLYLAKTSDSLANIIYPTEDSLWEHQGKISLLDIEPETFQLLLHYAYLGELREDSTRRQLKKLLLAAEIYNFPYSMLDDIEELLNAPADEAQPDTDEKRGKKRKSSSTSQPPKKKRKSSDFLESDEFSHAHWQKCLTSVVERDQEIFKKKYWTDCIIELGCSAPECNNEPTTSFQCHRLMLTKTSKVLDSLLSEHVATPDNQTIHIHNVSEQNFQFFLRYAYEGQLNLNELWKNEQFWSFMEFAKDFSLPDRLQEQCHAFVFSKIYSYSIWDVLKYAEEHEDRLLVEACGKTLLMFPDKCIKWLSKLEDDSRNIIHWLVKQDRLALSELDLFIECVNWAKRSLKAPGLKLTPKDLRTHLEPILPHIRFRAMSRSEFEHAAYYSGIFSKEECDQITKGDPRNLSNISHPDNEARETPVIDSLYVFGCHPDDLKLQYRYNIYLAFLYCLKPSKDNKEFHEVQIPSQMKPTVELGDIDAETVVEDFYWEDLTVYICCVNRNKKTRATKLLHKQRFCDYVGYDTTITIQLDETVKAHPTKMSMVGIVPHRSGRYPYVLEQGNRNQPTMHNKFILVS